MTNIDIIQALDNIRINNLYVHNSELEGAKFSNEKLKDRKVYLVETLAVINALVERGTMMLYGGHGGGKTTLSKYLGQLFCHLTKEKIEDCILRGHPQLTEEKILGSLDFAQMTGNKPLDNGKLSVVWNEFVTSRWKIIDEINRGEISKIFGELFFAVDPGYRGMAGEVSTQYANLHADINEKFYIPDNVYIIGTMNDIDRSVDSFDFAMRRRFRFVELRADERLEMLANLNNEEKEAEAITRMSALNVEIAATEGLNENYQIGASYFLKLKNIDFDQLWSDYLHPLLQEYINGMYDEEGIMERFKKAYNQGKSDGVDVDESN